MKVSRLQYSIFFTLILSAGLFLRTYKLNTTYPLNASFSQGIYSDEGVLAANARSKILFDKWVVDEYSYSTPYFLLPVYNFLVYSTFYVLGVGLVELRIMHVAVFALTYFLIHLILRHGKVEYEYILFSLILYSFSSLNILYNRVGLTENPMILFIGISIYFYILSENKKFFAFFSGIFAVLGILIKTYAGLLIPVLFIDFFIRLITSFKRKKERRDHINKFLLFSLGLLICGAAFWIFHMYPNLKELQKCILFEKDPSGTHIPALKNLIIDYEDLWPILYNLLLMPDMMAIILMYCISLKRPFFREGGESLIALFFFAFFLLFLSMPYKPPRRIVILAFPISILTAYFLKSHSTTNYIRRLIIYSLLTFPLFCYFSIFFNIKYESIIALSYEEQLFYIGILLVFISISLLLLFKNKISVFHFHSHFSSKIIIGFSILFFMYNMFSWHNVLKNSTPWIYSIGKDMEAALPAKSIIVGEEASSIGLENKAITYRSVPKDFSKKYYLEKHVWEGMPSGIDRKRKPFKSYLIQKGDSSLRKKEPLLSWDVHLTFWKYN